MKKSAVATPRHWSVLAPLDAGEDARLFERVRARDLDAFEQLYRRYHPRLQHFLLNLIRRSTLVGEVLNDTMLVVWSKPESFRAESRLSTWIFGIAYRQGMRALARFDDPEADRAQEEEHEAIWAKEQVRPGDAIDDERVHRHLAAAMAKLSADHRAVVDLTYFQELGYREIAAILDCPAATVKTRMFHARRHLRRLLAGERSDWL